MEKIGGKRERERFRWKKVCRLCFAMHKLCETLLLLVTDKGGNNEGHCLDERGTTREHGRVGFLLVLDIHAPERV
ncbi:hypothetical protein EI42_01618 [Thermosporothrix hazakensis]|uniref:Uncharacterized protein n=1 Tax=Thermosporothrix hazakensis TaxID=644383 RepID=A0A326UBK4_THEHA|nr:hypothetical protein EI42_01618 [Thermosporothrix hazakensis]